MTQATVRYITNGFTVNWPGSSTVGVPASLYAASVPEAVYWLGRIFDPVTANPPARRSEAAAATPRVIDNEDPLLGMEAAVSDIASGGFLVRQQGAGLATRPIETYAASMDDVHGLLNLIFAPPPPAEEPSALSSSTPAQSKGKTHPERGTDRKM